MKNWAIVLFLVVFGCSQKETFTVVAESGETPAETVSKPADTPKTVYEKELDESLHDIADLVRIYETKWAFDKDIEGAAQLEYRIEFLKRGETVSKFSGKIQTDRGAGWSLIPDIMKRQNEETSDRRFVEIQTGYDACGYIHNHFLFFLDGGRVQQVMKHSTMMDSGFGTFTEYLPSLESGKATKFSTVRIDIGETETSTEENTMLEISYSDSINYVLQNGKWKAIPITGKDQPYRKEIKPFDVYYKVPE